MLLKCHHMYLALQCSVVQVAHIFNFWLLKLYLGQHYEDERYVSHSIFSLQYQYNFKQTSDEKKI